MAVRRGGAARCCRSDVAAISPDCYLSVIARRSAARPPAQGARCYRCIGPILELGNK